MMGSGEEFGPARGFGARGWLAVVAAWGLLHGLLFWIGSHPVSRVPWGDERMYQQLAAPAGPRSTAAIDPLWPPFYVTFLRPFAAAGAESTAVTLVQIGLLVLAASMLRLVSRRATGAARVGDWSCALLLLDPQVAAFAHFRWPEVVHLALFLAALWALVAHAQRWPGLALAGVLLGLALLTKSLLLPFVPLLPAPLVPQHGWRRGAPRAVLVLLVAAAIVLPTVLENGRRHDRFMIADSSRFNLWLGLQDESTRMRTVEAYRRYVESGASFGDRQRALDTALGALWRERGPLALFAAQLRKQYFRLFDKNSVLTDQLPGGFIAARRAGYPRAQPAIADLLRAWSYAIYALVLAAAGPGLVAARLRDRPWLQMLWCFLGYNVLLFLGLHAHSRLRVQFMPVLDVAAALTLTWLTVRGPAEARALLAPPRLIPGAVVSVLLLGLAFGGALLR
jgi:Dolichyl-phosphate-mannose-protein mannosyltransferase